MNWREIKMLNREGLERDCTVAERAEVFTAVAGKQEQQILNLQVVVKNDGQEVFRGMAQEWLNQNDGDDDVLRLITDCFYEGQASEHFISGLWEVRTMQ
jgi:hypothetical protein